VADETITEAELEAAIRRLAEITGNRDAYYPALATSIVEHVRERRARLTADAIRCYLRRARWTEGGRGPAGSLWTSLGGTKIAVPHDDSDPSLIAAAIERLARTEGIGLALMSAEVLRALEARDA
jgi:hypothetical protein